MRVPKELGQALKLAMSGQLEETRPVIKQYFDSGDPLAGLTLAEIYGLEKQWKECFHCASQYLLAPNSQVNPMNVYIECVHLISASCIEEPSLVPLAFDLIENALRAIEKSVGNLPSAPALEQLMKAEGISSQQITTSFHSLKNYGVRAHARYLDELRTFLLTGDFERAFYSFESPQSNPQLVPDEGTALTDEELTRLYSLCASDCSSLMKLNERYGISIPLTDRVLVNLAKCYIAKGNEVEAWNAIKALLVCWRPVTPYMILPSVLISDPKIRVFLTEERIAEIVSSPKGGTVFG